MSDVLERPTKAGALEAMRRDRPEWAANLIMAGLCGSDAHGTKLPPDHPMATDDLDTFGIAVAPVDWYLGLGGYNNPNGRMTWTTAGSHYDHLVYDVRKFFALLVKGNPNVQGWLWTHADDVLLMTKLGRMIIAHRDMFISRACFTALAGYAIAQMQKMEQKEHRGYMGAKRKAIVNEIGYDVKHAAHCIRLLYLGIELAQHGTMYARRPENEAAELMAIKAGEWEYGAVQKHAEDLFCLFRDAEKLAGLPPEADVAGADRLLVRVIREANVDWPSTAWREP